LHAVIWADASSAPEIPVHDVAERTALGNLVGELRGRHSAALGRGHLAEHLLVAAARPEQDRRPAHPLAPDGGHLGGRPVVQDDDGGDDPAPGEVDVLDRSAGPVDQILVPEGDVGHPGGQAVELGSWQ
jgi:hypothetical protein